MENLLAIDIGSNTIKKLSLSCKDGKLVEGQSLSLPIRISKNNALVEDVVGKISYAINHFLDNESGNFQVRAIATSAMRASLDKDDICRQVFENTGINIEVIAGEKEAYLSALGAIFDNSIKIPRQFLFMDLGGGSLELAFCENKKITKVDSFPLGAVALTDAFIENPSDIIEEKTLDEINIYCKKMLESFSIKNEAKIAIGTGGAIAAAKYMLEKLGLKNFEQGLKKSDLEYLLGKISKESVESRIKNYSIPENRADIIPASFVCLIACMQVFRLEEMLYANQSLRRGLGVEHFNLS